MMFMSRLGRYSKNAYMSMVLLGAVLVLFGFLLLIMPELLAYLISFFFIIAGIIVLSMGWRLRQTERKIRSKVENVGDTIRGQINHIKDTFDGF
jgi:uncharacterized membrane protein HdeD (DUF308 family)